MPIKSIRVLLVSTILFLAGCGVQEINKAPATSTPFIITGTLPPTLAPPPSATPPPPTPLPTITPIDGIAATQLNVRAEPSTAGVVLGIIPANTTVQIIGKDPGENWWQILYPQGEDGKGWVTAQYITTASMPEVPVIGGAEPDAENANVAVIQQQLNVRSGPGTDFNSVGTLNAQDVARLTGKDSNGAWLQIEFAAGPEGRGWINAAFAQAEGVENLPIVSESGTVVGTGTPVNTPQPPTPTVVPAPIDNDSAQSPAIDIVFSANGTRAIQYTSDLSAPTGDTDDWLRFTPFTRSVRIELTCIGNGLLSGEVLQNDQPIQELVCGANQAITTIADMAYLLHLRATTGALPSYVQFTLKIVPVP